jgi:hypothetical protein
MKVLPAAGGGPRPWLPPPLDFLRQSHMWGEARGGGTTQQLRLLDERIGKSGKGHETGERVQSGVVSTATERQ